MNSQDDLPGAGPTPVSPAAAPAGGRYDAVVEQFARDYLKERRSERRWRVFFRIMWLVLLLLIVLSLFSARKAANVPSGAHTALIDIHGEIADDSEASAERIVSALKTAFDESSAKAIVLRFNSPGGSPVQAGIVYDELKRLKATHKKKVYAVCEEMCASGAYYMAVGADRIYVDKASIVGSIGVLMDGFGFVGTMDKLGVQRRLYTAGENKGMNDPFSPETEKQKAYTLGLLEQIHQQFIHVVKEGRGDRLKPTPEMFSGLYWDGAQAVQLGLADGLGNVDYVARDLVHAEEIVDYTSRENLAERLAKRMGAAASEAAIHALRRWGGLR